MTRDRRPLDSLDAEKPWILTGGAALAFIAGWVNAVVLGFYHVPVSHMSGAASRIGIDIASGDLSHLRVIAAIVGGFFIGAVVSGAVTGHSSLKPGRRYGVVLLIEGAALAAAAHLLSRGRHLGVPAAAFACGLQNAMATSYYGLVIRTTHVTGIVTDLGIMAGQWLRRHRPDGWRLAILTALLAGFTAGGLAGSYLFIAVGVRALLGAAFACTIGGLGYWLWLGIARRAAG